MKRHRSLLIRSTAFAFLAFIVSAPAAHAYIDPGTGSYVIQILIAALAGVAVGVKIYWGRIKRFFSRSSDEPLDGGGDVD